MTIDGRLDAYQRGELTLGELVDELPIVADANPALMELLDLLEAGLVPPEVVAAWSHPEADHPHDASESHAALHAHGEPHQHHGEQALHDGHATAIHHADGTSPDRAWKFLPKPMVD